MPSPAAAGAVELHRARFVEWTPAAVAALAATADGSALAVGRDDGSIELYDVGGDWRCALRIPGCEGASITCLLWCESGGDSSAAAAGGAAAAPAAPLRLLSAGLSGHIVEWDLRTLRPLASTDSTGGPVWHMSARPCVPSSASPQCFAVACDDGCLRLFEPASKGVAYARSFPRIEARLLCTAWHPNCTTIVVGSSDGCLRCWDSRTTTELLRITLTHGAAARVTPCVWAVLVLPDGTLASGDSEGCTSLWDGEHGTLRQSFKSHEADVLALASTPAGDAVFAAGVDSKVALLARVPSGTSGPTPDAALPPVAAWSLLGYKRAHTHDVRALAVAPFPPADARHDDGGGAQLGSMLLSAGTDAQLLAYAADNFLGEHPVRVVRTPAGPALSLAAHPLEALGARPLLLCMHSTWLDVWQIGVAAERSHAATPLVNGAALPLAVAPSLLARIRVRCQRHLLCSAIAGDGSCVAASDALAPHLFALSASASGKRVRVAKRPLAADLPPAQHMAFTADGQHVALAAPAGPVYLVAVSSGVVAHVFRSHLKPRSAPTPRTRFCIALPPVTHVSVSPDRQWLAVAVAADGSGPFASASRSGCVCIYSLEAQRTHAVLPLPSCGDASSPVVALAFSPLGDNLVAATAGKDIQVFSVESAAHCWSESVPGAALPERMRKMPGHVCALTMDPARGLAAVLAHTPHAVCHLDLTQPLGSDAPPLQKRRRVSGALQSTAPTAAAQAAGGNGRVIMLEHPCLFAGYFAAAVALLVERPWDSIMRALPPPLLRHRFGL